MELGRPSSQGAVGAKQSTGEIADMMRIQA
jgi:hypothetical protein